MGISNKRMVLFGAGDCYRNCCRKFEKNFFLERLWRKLRRRSWKHFIISLPRYMALLNCVFVHLTPSYDCLFAFSGIVDEKKHPRFETKLRVVECLSSNF